VHPRASVRHPNVTGVRDDAGGRRAESMGRSLVTQGVLIDLTCDNSGLWPLDWRLTSQRERWGKHMSLPETDYFDANLPGASQTVRIASLYDAKIFVCRWVIRDRDPALKALLRNLEKAKSFATTESAIQQLTQALASRGLLVTTSR
jgi:hypothetical protein